MEKIIIITGASSDLGMAYIKENAEDYDKIIAHYHHGSERFESLLSTYNDKITAIRADFSDEQGVSSFVRQLKEENIRPTHLLHLASLPVKSERFHKMDVAEYQAMMQVSLYSIIEILKVCIPAMQKQKYGKILFLLSAYTTIPNPKFAASYTVSKYALLGLMKSVAAEYVSKGITVNGISPQMIETKFIKDVPELMIEQHKAAAPLGRLMQTEDVLPFMKLLLSDDSAAITGENVCIGGASMTYRVG